MNMIQAQDRYIRRVNGCHPGHRNRVTRAASVELLTWARKRGYSDADCWVILYEARDIAKLQRNAGD